LRVKDKDKDQDKDKGQKGSCELKGKDAGLRRPGWPSAAEVRRPGAAEGQDGRVPRRTGRPGAAFAALAKTLFKKKENDKNDERS